MKTFFSTFAAILCAAAVIWGVYAHNESRRKEAESNLRQIRTLIEICETSAKIWDTASDETISTLSKDLGKYKFEFEQPARFVSVLNRDLPPDTDRWRLRRDFKDAYQALIEAIRQKGQAGPWRDKDPSKLNWADEMERRLNAALPDSK